MICDLYYLQLSGFPNKHRLSADWSEAERLPEACVTVGGDTCQSEQEAGLQPDTRGSDAP